MGTHIHVSGLSYFCTNAKLRQAFIPFGTVLLAQVLRDECGHALGLGIVHMARCEDVERVFNALQHFEISGSRVDLWEPAEPKTHQDERKAAHDLQMVRGAHAGHATGQKPNRSEFQRLAVLRQRLFQTLTPSSRIVEH
ncbi:MAG: RNA-binding protein [Nitrospirota bacterium]|nr:RNA-binding protein [Nitrospirota bacterium]MDP2381976.1 RNA-binding protein [Nitrospirota bacterium]MDP3595806.1 RNA-binding protein [Nitrospirota bacterium]